MTPELKEKWTKALRSGKYTQTRDFLKTDTGYCCLGVLCEVSGIKFNGKVTERGEETNLFDKTLKEIGLTFKEQSKVILMNDDQRFSFPAIADWIDANVKA